MPCRCMTNLQTALVLGIIFFIMEVINGIVSYKHILSNLKDYYEFSRYYKLLQYCFAQFVNTSFNLIMVFGAKKKKCSAFTLWMVLAVIKLIYSILAALLLSFKIVSLLNCYYRNGNPNLANYRQSINHILIPRQRYTILPLDVAVSILIKIIDLTI